MRALVPKLQLLPLKNEMAYLSQTFSLVFPGLINILLRCKLKGVQRKRELLVSFQGDGVCPCDLTADSRGSVRIFYLLETSRQVLDKEPPQVVKCLQLPGLQHTKDVCIIFLI